MSWYNPVSWFQKKEDGLLPDLVRVPVDIEFAQILDEYDSRRSKEKISLVLEGGGQKGLFQCGVLARLAELGILHRVDVILGTSVGGMNSCMVAHYLWDSPGLQSLVDVWRGITKNSDIYLGEMPSGIWSGLKTVLSGRLQGDSLLDNTPQYKLVYKHLSAAGVLNPPVYVVATDYVTGGRRLLGPEVSAVDQALATSAVPTAFKCYQGRYMDGGCVENLAVPTALDLGSTKVICIYCDSDTSHLPVEYSKPTSISTGTSALGALFQVQSQREYDSLERVKEMRELKGLSPLELLHIWPPSHTGALLEFGSRPDLLKMGYDTAVKYITPDKLKEFLCQ